MSPETPPDPHAHTGSGAPYGAPRSQVQPGGQKAPAWVAEASASRQAASSRAPRWKMPAMKISAMKMPAMLLGAAAVVAALVIAPLLWLGGSDADAQSSIEQPVATATAPASAAALPAPFEVAQAPQSAWRLRCADTNDASTCNANQELFLNREVEGERRNVGRLLNLTVLYLDAQGERLPFMSLQMPLGLDLRPGAVMQVDDGQEITLEFLRCTNDGCDASVRLTPDLLGAMRAGNVLRVGFRPWGGEQVTAVEASLIGFTAAFLQLR